jgi:hypothetical protein
VNDDGTFLGEPAPPGVEDEYCGENLNDSWTPEVDQQLRAMLLNGKSIPAIAARLKRTMGAVRSRANHLGLSVSVDRAVRDQRNAPRRAVNDTPSPK